MLWKLLWMRVFLLLLYVGMGGVGKTTMVKKIADEIKKENHFDEVVMAVVSQNYDPIHVQQQLAEKLGLEIKETILDARADRLHKRLMDQKKRILIILDDLWATIDLCDIGIPREVERKGLKVILTSRDSHVCSQMDAKTIITVEELIEEEAWSLFKKHANISDHDSDVLLQGYPKKAAKKCHGLPLAIEVIGKILKDKQVSEWRDVLKQLEKRQDSDTSKDIYDKVYSLIELSVNYIGGQRRSILLLCSLFHEDHKIGIEDLVRYAKGLQLFTSVESMEDTRDRVESIANYLKDCYLLIACGDHCVTLHDVVRDTCLRIASKGENVHLVSNGGLKEWPDKDLLESSTSISLDFNDDVKELPSELNCSMLQLLRLSFVWRERGHSWNILISILQAAKNLRVLNIINSTFRIYGTELPTQSIQNLNNLRTLDLQNCNLDGYLSSLLGSVVNVEVLSFYNSRYKGKWPAEIGQLRKLRSLDLRFQDGPIESLPTGFLTKLKNLEEIYLGTVLDMRLPESGEIIKEIGSLHNLNTFEILGCHDSRGLAVLVENLVVERLLRFYISLNRFTSPYHFSTTMDIGQTNMGMLSNPKMKAWLSRVDEFLNLGSVTGGEYDLVKDFDGGTIFSRLRNLRLCECGMKYIFNTMNSDTKEAIFVELKKMCIVEADQLEEVWHGEIPVGSFARLETLYLSEVPHLSSLWCLIKPPSLGNLTTLEIKGADIIKSLFLRSSVRCLARLRKIVISDCPNLGSLVCWDEQIEEDTAEDNKAQFPALEELRLFKVNQFKTLISEPEAPMVESRSTNSNISSFPKLRILKIFGSEHLHVGDVIKNGQYLSSLEMSKCSFEVCFDFEGWRKEITGEIPESLFPNLDELSLERLHNLRHLWRSLPQGIVAFQKLSTLTIYECRDLRYLLTPPMVKMLKNLKELEIFFCEKMESIIGTDEAATNEVIELPELCKLALFGLPELRMLSSHSAHLSLPSLSYFFVTGCPRMSKFCAGNLSAPQLKKVLVKISFEIDRNTMDNWLKDCELLKRCLDCSAYGNGETCDHLAKNESRCTEEAGASSLTPTHKIVTESGIIVHSRSDVDLLDDGYKWRKYGQKVVKGNPNSRSYYQCTHVQCGILKHVERATTYPKIVTTTYRGKHNHVLPQVTDGET